MFKGLILIDNDQVDYSLALVDVVNRLAGEEETCVYGLGINLPEKVKGLDAVIQVDAPTIQPKDSRLTTDIIEQVHRKYQFDSIIILATEFGRMVAPRLAMRLEVGLVADITDIQVDKRGKKLIRPAFSGNIMASVHPNVFQTEDLTKEPEVIDFIPTDLKASSIEVLEVVESAESTVDIREADVIVSAGGGFTQPIDQLQDLADELTGVVAASKQLVDRKRRHEKFRWGNQVKQSVRISI